MILALGALAGCGPLDVGLGALKANEVTYRADQANRRQSMIDEMRARAAAGEFDHTKQPDAVTVSDPG